MAFVQVKIWLEAKLSQSRERLDVERRSKGIG